MAGFTKIGRGSESARRAFLGPAQDDGSRRGDPGVSQERLEDALVHADGRGRHARSDVRHAQGLEEALERAVLAGGAVDDRKHDVDAAGRDLGRHERRARRLGRAEPRRHLARGQQARGLGRRQEPARLVTAMATTSYFAGSSDAAIVRAEIRETSRSTDLPPKRTATRVRLTSSPRGRLRPPGSRAGDRGPLAAGAESTAITAAARSPPPRASEKLAMLTRASPRIVPTLPTTPGTSRLRRKTTVPSGRNSSGRPSTCTTRASVPEKSVASARRLRAAARERHAHRSGVGARILVARLGDRQRRGPGPGRGR